MKFLSTDIADVLLIEPQRHDDQRGYFMEFYNRQDFANAGISLTFVQDNHSGSHRGVLRGLHYQICHAQGRLVRAVAGELFDVAVDLRRGSPTLGKWIGEILSADNQRMLWIPPGFAHGYYVLSEWAEITYKVTDYYAPNCERTLLWNDPEMGIHWPLSPNAPLLMAEKDMQGKPLREAELYE
jgi:dTDP-4-dehydrorhamnose 3,5-epimerase